MNIGQALINPNGRSGQQEYWIGILILVAANIVSGFIPVLGTLIWIGLIYVGVCIYGRRLHDAGKSAWLHAIPWAVSIVLCVVGSFFIIGALIAAIQSGDENFNIIAVLTASGGALAFFGLSYLVWIVYTIWAGLLKGDPGANRFGPPPQPEAPTFTPAAPSAQPSGGQEPPRPGPAA